MKNTFEAAAMLAAIVCFGLIPLTACAEEESSAAQTRDIVIALFEAFNAHDLDAVLALYHPDVMKINPSHPEPRYGKEVIREIYSSLFQQLPGVQDTIGRIICEGNQASVEFTASWPSPVKDGTSIDQELKVAAFIKIKHGKIIEDVTYYDRMAFAPPSGEDQPE